MKEIRNPKVLAEEMSRLHGQGKSIGFVPTMGALHEGHLSLLRAARRENAVVVASIFVNPTQFGPKEDFRRYPRPLAKDRSLLKKAKVDYLFRPSVQAMYPEGFSFFVGMEDRGRRPAMFRILCGKFRPGHFRGVATIVTKLFHLVQPDRVYFGAKDYQQAAIVRQLIRDLHFAVALRILPTVREKGGLAMSSRNRYLSPRDRNRALAISETLFWLRREFRGGRHDLGRLRRAAMRRLHPKVDHLEYLEIVDPVTLQSLRWRKRRMAALTACVVNKTRLIDNVIIHA